MYEVTDSMLYLSHGSWGEDRLFFGNNFCGVIDGATPIDNISINGYQTQAEWFAEKMKTYFEKLGTIVDFPEACSAFIDSINNGKEIHTIPSAYNLPSATIAAVVEKDGFLKGYVLGDCGIIVLNKNKKYCSLYDNRVSEFSKQTINARNIARDLLKDEKSAVKLQKIQNRHKMNVPGGYWTVAPTGNFTSEFSEFQIPSNDIDKCILYTDGLSQICELSDINIYTLLNEENPGSLINDHLERIYSQNNFHTNAFIKKLDDVGMIILKSK